MKKLLFTFVSFALFIQAFGQWVDISPTGDQITKLWFKNSQEGFAAGHKIQYTNNGGQNWTELEYFNEQIEVYTCLNNNCYAGINTITNKYIIYSSDNWITYDTIFQCSSQINCIKPISINEIFVGTYNGLLHTNDGFITIDTLLQGTISSILNIQDSIFFAGNYRSFDYGLNWTPLSVGVNSFGTFNSSNNIVSGFDFFTIYFSGDYGTTWSTYPVPTSQGYFEPGDVLFLDSLNILACGPRYHGNYSIMEPGYQYLILSTDGAQTWNPVFYQTTPYDTDQMNSFVYFPNDTIFVCGSNKVLKTYSPLTNSPEQFTDNSDLNLFPNPVSNLLTIYNKNNTHDIFTIIIYNNQGNIVKQISTLQPDNTVNVIDLPAGIYLVKISAKDTFKCKRFVKL